MGTSPPCASIVSKTKILSLLWLASVVSGTIWMYKYSAQSVPLLEAKKKEPDLQRSLAEEHRPDLILFLHPQCDCSRATLTELESILPDLHSRARIRAYFYAPTGRPKSWVRSALWKGFSRLPGVEVIEDSNGDVASRFRAEASGESFLYDADGKLVFHGGITPSRGHAGDSRGREAILSWFAGKPLQVSQTRVFGCRFRAENASQGKPI